MLSYFFLLGIGFAQQMTEWDDFSLRVQNGHCVADGQCIYRIMDNTNRVLYQTKNETKPSYLDSFHDGHRDFETFQNGTALRHVYHGDVDQYDTNVISDINSDEQEKVNLQAIVKPKESKQPQALVLNPVENKDAVSEEDQVANSPSISSSNSVKTPRADKFSIETENLKEADDNSYKSSYKAGYDIGQVVGPLLFLLGILFYFLLTFAAMGNKACQN